MEAPFFPRLALVVGGLIRVAYGLHALLAPEAMGRRRLAPRTHGKADPRLSLRGFGGQLVVLGAFTLLAWLRSPRQAPPQFRVEGILRLFLADALPAGDQRALVRRLADQARGIEDQIRGEIVPVAEELARSGTRFPAITARLGADLFGFGADWLERLEGELAGG